MRINFLKIYNVFRITYGIQEVLDKCLLFLLRNR